MPPPPDPTAPKPRPYKRLLTSALHTRFVQAASLTYIWHLGIAYLTAERNRTISGLFWSCFPIGPAGVKAGLFCLSSIFIFTLEIATLNIGRRITTSNFKSVKSSIFSSSTYATIFWYLMSAWWFCEIYVFTSPASKELGWVLHRRYDEPARLNERPVYLRMFFLQLGVIGALSHIYYDRSSLHIKVMKPPTPQATDQKTHPDNRITAKLTSKLPSIAVRASISSGLCTVLGPFLYTGLFRGIFWSIHVNMAKTFVNIARSDAHPPRGFYIGSIMLRAAFFGFLLSLTWEITLLFFYTYMLQEPLKKGLPLSASSKDPNGSLLNGVAAKRDLTKTFAFWELAIIGQSHADRRKAIFADIDRPTGPIWKSMLESALSIIASIDKRIIATDPPSIPSTSAAAAQGETVTENPNVQHLPRLLPNAQNYDKPSLAAEATTSRSQKIGNFFKHEAKILGSSPNPWSPPVDRAKQRFHQLAQAGAEEYSKYDAVAMQTPLGTLLLTTPERIINSTILGTPIGNAALLVDAIEAVTRMSVSSLSEDTFGKAVAGVPSTVKQFTKTITSIEKFVSKQKQVLLARLQQHPQATMDALEEVSIVQAKLKQGLRELLAAFHVFLHDVGLAIRDLNEAKAAAEPRDLIPNLSAEGGSVDPQKQLPHLNGQAKRPGVQKEMEQVGGVSRRPAREGVPDRQDAAGSQNYQSLPSKRPPQQLPPSTSASAPGSATGTGYDRPGRLFSQLDPGSAYSERSQPQQRPHEPVSASTVPARMKSGNALNDIAMKQKARTDNVFGARDSNRTRS